MTAQIDPQRGLTAQLENLAAKAAAAQACLVELDWEAQAPKLAPWRRPVARGIVTEFIGGEEATARLCREIAPRISLPAARKCLQYQVEDETRHAALYRRYLARIGGQAPQRNFLDAAVDRSLSWNGAPEAALLAFHIIVEGEALALQDKARDWIPDPLFEEMSRQIARDEARHVAFGKIYLAQSLPNLPLQERIEIYRWLRGLWFESVTGLAGGGLGGIMAAKLPRSWMQKRWDGWTDSLRATGLFAGAELVDFTAS